MRTSGQNRAIVGVILVATIAALATLTVALKSRTDLLNNPTIRGQFPLRQLWSFQVDGKIVVVPTVSDQLVVVRTVNEISALDVSTGEHLWSAPVWSGDNPSPVLIGEGIVVAANSAGVWAFKADTGDKLWESDLSTMGQDAHVEALTNKLVLVVRDLDTVDAYDPQNGHLLWQIPIGRKAVQTFLENDSLYLITNDELGRYSAATGDLISQTQLGLAGPAIFSDGIFYYVLISANARKTLVSFEVTHNTELWQTELPESINRLSLLDGKLFIGTVSSIYSVDAQSGLVLWRATGVDADSFQTPVRFDEDLYVRGLFKQEIVALDAAKGNYLGLITAGPPTLFAPVLSFGLGPVVYKDMLLFPVGNRIFAYGE